MMITKVSVDGADNVPTVKLMKVQLGERK